MALPYGALGWSAVFYLILTYFFILNWADVKDEVYHVVTRITGQNQRICTDKKCAGVSQRTQKLLSAKVHNMLRAVLSITYVT